MAIPSHEGRLARQHRPQAAPVTHLQWSQAVGGPRVSSGVLAPSRPESPILHPQDHPLEGSCSWIVDRVLMLCAFRLPPTLRPSVAAWSTASSLISTRPSATEAACLAENRTPTIVLGPSERRHRSCTASGCPLPLRTSNGGSLYRPLHKTTASGGPLPLRGPSATSSRRPHGDQKVPSHGLKLFQVMITLTLDRTCVPKKRLPASF